MQGVHVYEEAGNVHFRRSGNGVTLIEQCRIIRTRVADAKPEGTEGTWRVLISVLVTGYEPLYFPTWFQDWTDSDCMVPPDYQSGRPVHVAVPIVSFDQMLRSGRPIGTESASRHLLGRPSLTQRTEGFHPVVAAVLIDGTWQEPLAI